MMQLRTETKIDWSNDGSFSHQSTYFASSNLFLQQAFKTNFHIHPTKRCFQQHS